MQTLFQNATTHETFLLKLEEDVRKANKYAYSCNNDSSTVLQLVINCKIHNSSLFLSVQSKVTLLIHCHSMWGIPQRRSSSFIH